MTLPNLPPDMEESEFEDIMAALMALQGCIDEAMSDLPEDARILQAVQYYGQLSKEVDLYDPYALRMTATAAGAVITMRGVVHSMYDDAITEITEVKDAEHG